MVGAYSFVKTLQFTKRLLILEASKSDTTMDKKKTTEKKAMEIAHQTWGDYEESRKEQLNIKAYIQDACIDMAKWEKKHFIKTLKDVLMGYISHSDYFTREDFASVINKMEKC